MPVVGGDLANQRWYHYMEANAGIIPMLPEKDYGDACITRMDTHRELHTEEWWLSMSALWADKDVALVRGTDRSLTPEMLFESPGAPESLFDIMAQVRHSFDMFDALFEKVMATKRDTVLLCVGPVAKPLVHKLVAHGVRAYDLGHLGVWFKNGLPKAWDECRA